MQMLSRVPGVPGWFGKTLAIALGCVALILGIIGLLLPILPGVLFLAVAVVCFAQGSARMSRWLRSKPRLQPYLARWEAGRQLPILRRVTLAAWLLVAATGDTLKNAR